MLLLCRIAYVGFCRVLLVLWPGRRCPADLLCAVDAAAGVAAPLLLLRSAAVLLVQLCKCIRVAGCCRNGVLHAAPLDQQSTAVPPQPWPPPAIVCLLARAGAPALPAHAGEAPAAVSSCVVCTRPKFIHSHCCLLYCCLLALAGAPARLAHGGEASAAVSYCVLIAPQR